MIRKRLADEALVASRFGTGPWALFRGAVSELTRKGMRNRVLLVFCSFALQNMSGAAGKLSTAFLHKTLLTIDSYQLLLTHSFRFSRHQRCCPVHWYLWSCQGYVQQSPDTKLLLTLCSCCIYDLLRCSHRHVGPT